MRRILHLSHNTKNARIALVSTPAAQHDDPVTWVVQDTEVTNQRIHSGWDAEALATMSVDSLLKGHSEVNLAMIGTKLEDTSVGYAPPKTKNLQPRFERSIQIFTPDGTLKETQPLKPVASNVNGAVPLVTQPKKKMPLTALFQKFVFARQFQLCHEDGVQYEFLFQLAKELEEQQVGLYLGAGKLGNEKVVFTDNGSPYHCFLVGRTQGTLYRLLVLCTNQELKIPAPTPTAP